MTTATVVSEETATIEEIDLESIQPGRNTDLSGTQLVINEAFLTRKTLLKVIAASISFFFAGNNDGSLGALTPYILRTYNVGTEYVALM
jgi:hypothetical protein